MLLLSCYALGEVYRFTEHYTIVLPDDEGKKNMQNIIKQQSALGFWKKDK